MQLLQDPEDQKESNFYGSQGIYAQKCRAMFQSLQVVEYGKHC
jgi:hypothetical protein